MPGRARVHELAKELGVSSKQVLSRAQDLGLYVKSPSSTIEAADARRLRDSFTGGQVTPARQPLPQPPVGNNPYSTPRPAPRDPMPPQRASPPRRRPLSAGPPPDDFAAGLRRALANSRPSKTRHMPKPNPIVDIILERSPGLWRPGERIPRVVHEWAQMWIEEWFEPDEVTAWMDAGLKGNDAHRAAELRQDGCTPDTWARRGKQTS